MKRTAESQFQMGFSPSYYSCPLGRSLIALALLILIVFGFHSSTPSPIFVTFSALVLSTLIIFVSKMKIIDISEENSLKAEVPLNNNGPELLAEMEVGMKIQLENDGGRPDEEARETTYFGQIHDSTAKSPELYSDSSSIDLSSTTEDSDVDACSDCSISDDDSLIEIALPDGRYIAPQDELEGSFQPYVQEFKPEVLFKEHGLMELLSEINDIYEEDNLIEIDISVGSIKCSRVKIQT